MTGFWIVRLPGKWEAKALHALIYSSWSSNSLLLPCASTCRASIRISCHGRIFSQLAPKTQHTQSTNISERPLCVKPHAGVAKPATVPHKSVGEPMSPTGATNEDAYGGVGG